MADFINLIPQEEKQEQVQVKLVKVSTVVTLVLVVVVALISGFFFYRINTLKSQSVQLDNEIDMSRTEIQQLTPIEIGARNLETRYKILSDLFASRVYYSKLLEEFTARVPGTIKVTSFNIQPGNKIALNGTGDNYMAIADFISKLTESKELFTDVTLSSVNLENASNRAGFFIVITYQPEALKKVN